MKFSLSVASNALKLKREGKTYSQIAKELGIDIFQAVQQVRRAKNFEKKMKEYQNKEEK